MKTLNQLNLIGNLVRDAELKSLPNGTPAVRFTVVTEENWKDKNTQEWKKETEFHNCDLIGAYAETIGKNFKRGCTVYVCGSQKTRKYTDAKGVEQTYSYVKVKDTYLVGKHETGGTPGQAKAGSDYGGSTGNDDFGGDSGY